MSDLADYSRDELLDTLAKWNERLAELGARPQITVDEAAALRRVDQLRRVVSATGDRLVEVIVNTSRR